MSPIELIREGFLNSDWTMIVEAYQGLTGIRLEKTATPQPEKENKIILPRELNRGTPLPQQTQIKSPNATTRRQTTDAALNSDKKLCIREPLEVGTFVNLFVDDGTLAPGDRAIDKLIKKHVSPRERDVFEPKIKQCRTCDKKFTAVTDMEYLCDRCSKTPSR